MINAGVALDVDGVVADTFPENYNRLVETWAELHRGRPYPIDFDTVLKNIRPHITRIEHFFSATFAIMDNGWRVPSDLPELATNYRAEEALRHKDAYYHMRKMGKYFDMAGWLAEQSLYPGVPGMLKQLGEMEVGVWIVSGKDGKTIRDLWEFHKLPNPRGVYDKDTGERPEQLGRFLQDTGIQAHRAVVYDDAAVNLAIADSLDMLPVGAPQGYELPERIGTYRLARSAEFPGVVRELLSI